MLEFIYEKTKWSLWLGCFCFLCLLLLELNGQSDFAVWFGLIGTISIGFKLLIGRLYLGLKQDEISSSTQE